MRKYEPDFDLFALENEVDEVLKQLLNAFFKDDLETVQKLSANTALGQLTGLLRARKEMVFSSYYIMNRVLNVNTRSCCISIKQHI